MTEGLVSVVVPIYNVEAYLDRCVQSIVDQTYRELEIILVDDGSPDRCPQMCEEWKRKDSRIVVVHKENAGPGMARNTGIDHAHGEYICFFDSDDYIACDTIESAYKSAKEHCSDIVLFGMAKVDPQGNVTQAIVPNVDKPCFAESEIFDLVLPAMMVDSHPFRGKNHNLNMSVCCAIYSMELICRTGQRFVSEREYCSEDFYFLFNLYPRVERVSVVAKPLYHYCYNGTSLSHTYLPDRYTKLCQFHSAMIEAYRHWSYPEVIENCIHSQYIGGVIAAMKLIVSYESEKKKAISLIRDIVRDDYFQQVVNSVELREETPARRLFLLFAKHRMSAAVWLSAAWKQAHDLPSRTSRLRE